MTNCILQCYTSKIISHTGFKHCWVFDAQLGFCGTYYTFGAKIAFQTFNVSVLNI